MMDWKEFSEWLIRQVAPEHNQAIYLLGADDAKAVDSRLDFPQHAGWTNPLCDLIFSSHFSACDQWRGRGFCCVVDADKHDSIQSILGCALHEYAHWLTFAEVSSDDAVDLPLGQAALEVVPERWSRHRPPDLPAWTVHGAAFVRACVHLAYRAGQHIESLRPSHLRFGCQYYGEPFNEAAFLSALSCELDDPRPIRQVIQSDEPEPFTRLWEMAAS